MNIPLAWERLTATTTSPDRPADNNLLARSILFSCLRRDEQASLMRLAKRMRAPDRSIIFSKGDPGRQMFAIVQGGVKISTVSENGREIVFGILGQGDFFGEISLLDGRERSAGATALGDVEMLAIERKDFLGHMQANPVIAINLLRAFAQRLRATDALVEDNAFLSLPARLAKRLLILGECYGIPTPSGRRIGIRLSQQEIANLVGATRESVNKLLRLWGEAGLLGRSGGYLLISDEKSLQEAAEL